MKAGKLANIDLTFNDGAGVTHHIPDALVEGTKFLGLDLILETRPGSLAEFLTKTLEKRLGVLDECLYDARAKKYFFDYTITPIFRWYFAIYGHIAFSTVKKLQKRIDVSLRLWLDVPMNTTMDVVTSRNGLGMTNLIDLWKRTQAMSIAENIRCMDPFVSEAAKERAAVKTKQNAKLASTLRRAAELAEEDDFKTKILRKCEKSEVRRLREEHEEKRCGSLWTMETSTRLNREFAAAIWNLPAHLIRFATKTLSYSHWLAADMVRLDPKTDPLCVVCRKHRETLSHVLAGCPVALHQGRQLYRHNQVLAELYNAPSPSWYTVSGATKRPDMIVTDPRTRRVWILELTVPMERNMAKWHEIKEWKYASMAKACVRGGHASHCSNFAFEVGAAGKLAVSTLILNKLLGKHTTEARLGMAKAALKASLVLFEQRDSPDWSAPTLTTLLQRGAPAGPQPVESDDEAEAGSASGAEESPPPMPME